MKKIAFVFRDSFDAKYICSELSKMNSVADFIFIRESGNVARKKKIRRMLKQKNIFSCFVNFVSLFLFDWDMTNKMKNMIGKKTVYPKVSYFDIDDINEKKAIDYIRESSVDVVLDYGSSIITQKSIQLIGKDIYNIHSSILPSYRNVHSDFWAFMNNDFDKIGLTLFKLNEGVDTGKICFQRKALDGNESMEKKLEWYKTVNLMNVPKVIIEFVEKLSIGNIECIEQKESDSSISYTPNTIDIIRMYKKNRKIK